MEQLTKTQWRRIEPILDRLLEAPPEQRRQLIEAAGLEAPAQAYLDTVLARLDAPHPLFETDPQGLLAAMADAPFDPEAGEPAGPGELVGRDFGDYHAVGVIGRGGMGTVLRAERTDGRFEREVAIKVVNAAFDAGHRRRFQEEMRTLARLEHPGIVRLLDSGVTADGAPYIVMEFCEGERLDRWCDARRLDPEARIRLVIQLCEAVDYAHRSLVVHRDLKPANVMVDGNGAVKVVDFGVARTLDALDDGAGQTRTFTPGYGAPEQIAGGALTTATDVYAISVLLGELLFGALAELPSDWSKTLPTQLERWLKFWSRGRRSEPACAALAAQRGASAERVAALLRGDFRYILALGLANDPGARYVSARELGEDLRRHLASRPVSARPRSVVHAAARFARRNTLPVVLATAAGLGLVGGLGVALWQAQRAEAAAQDARAEAVRATAVTGFLQSIFDGVDPWRNQQRAVTADQLVDQALGRADTELSPYPALQADVLTSLGDILAKLGRYEEGKKVLTRSVSLLRSHGDEESLLKALVELAAVNSRLDDLSTGEALLAEALSFGLTPVSENRVQARLSHAGLLCVRLGRCDEAAESLREIESRRIDIQALPGGDGLLADLTMQWASWEFASGNYAAAAERALEAADAYRALHGPDHLSIAQALSYASSAYHSLGDSERSAPLEREALRIYRNAFGLEHPDTLAMVVAVGTTHSNAGRIAEAREHYLQALEGFRAIHGEDHSLVAAAWRNLAQADRLLGDYPGAAAGMKRAVEILRSSDFQDYRVPLTEALLGRILSEWGRRADADAAFTAGLRGLEAAVGASHPLHLRIDVEYAAHLLRSGDATDAEAARTRLESTYPALEAAYGSESVYAALAATWLGIARLRLGEDGGPDLLDAARPILERVPSRYRVELAAMDAAAP